MSLEKTCYHVCRAGNVIASSVQQSVGRILQKFIYGFLKTFWRTGTWLKEELIDFGGDADSCMDPG